MKKYKPRPPIMKYCEMCGSRFKARAHNTMFCGSQFLRLSCSWKNQRQSTKEYSRTYISYMKKKKEEFLLRNPNYDRDRLRLYRINMEISLDTLIKNIKNVPMSHLTRERMNYLFGLSDGTVHNMAETGRKFGVSRSWIRWQKHNTIAQVEEYLKSK